MLTRILLPFLLLAALAMPPSALALGVGPIEVRSALNQNFEADIPLIINNPVELTGLAVRIPRQQDFDQMGIERLELLSNLKFAIPKPGDPPLIRITSQEPIREPNFELLLEIVWPRGRLFRKFPVHLDPELYVNRRQPSPPALVLPPPPAIAATPTAAVTPPPPVLPPARPVSFEGASFYQVKPGETLRAVANRVRPSSAISMPEMMAILVAGNPEAFTNGNPNTLRAGATLRVPTPQALGVSSPAPASPAIAAALPAEPAATLPPPAPEPVVSPPAPVTDSAPPAMATVPVTPPPVPVPVTPAPLPTPAEQPREIIPQASVPQPEPAPPPVAAAPSEPVKSPPPATSPSSQPEPVKSPPPAVKSPPPPAETELSWMDNPVVWIAIVVIVLAVAAMALFPWLRRRTTARPSPAGAGADASSSKQVQDSQPRTRRTQQSVGEAAAVSDIAAADLAPKPAAAPTPRPMPAADLAPKPAAAPTPRPMPAAGLAPKSSAAVSVPKPIDELLKDIDFGLGSEQLSTLAVGKDAPAAGKGIGSPRLPDTEPPTSPLTSTPKPESAPVSPPIKPEDRPPPASHQTVDLPSDLRLDGMDFDFGDLGSHSARSEREELPPLELKSAASAGPLELPPLTLDVFEPLTESPSMAKARTEVDAAPLGAGATAPPPSQKFEFSDVSQDYKAPDEDSFRLDEELMASLGDQSLNLGKMALEEPISSASGADYVETKLDLATAYLDMGDQVGARSLLEDVLREGSTLQKKRADELLKKLG